MAPKSLFRKSRHYGRFLGAIGSVDSKPSQKFGPLGVLFGSTIISKSYFPKYWQYIRRTVVRRKPARIRANSGEFARTPPVFASISRRIFLANSGGVRADSAGVRRTMAEFARIRANSGGVRRELANC